MKARKNRNYVKKVREKGCYWHLKPEWANFAGCYMIIVEQLVCDMVQCADMIKKQITIMVALMMCIAPFSGSFVVVCYGADGHVAIEAAVHDHCNGDDAYVEGSHEHDEHQLRVADEHNHCEDVAIKSDIAVSAKRKDLTETSSVFAVKINLLKTSHSRDSEVYSGLWRNVESSSFFMPLSTIVLLA